jgi:hypothetical protein
VIAKVSQDRTRKVEICQESSPGLGSRGNRSDLGLHRLTLPLISATNQTRGRATSEILTSNPSASLDKNTGS